MSDPIFLMVGIFAVLFALGLALSLLSRRPQEEDPLKKQVRHLLPGINCAKCGHPGCDAFVNALLEGTAHPRQCLPGGPQLWQQLGEILGTPDDGGADAEAALFARRQIAIINPERCNGCGRCTKACPVDAIHGRRPQVPSIDAHECTGCGDCLKKCNRHALQLGSEPLTLRHYDWPVAGTETDQEDRRASC